MIENGRFQDIYWIARHDQGGIAMSQDYWMPDTIKLAKTRKFVEGIEDFYEENSAAQ